MRLIDRRVEGGGPAPEGTLEALVELLAGKRVVALTGAGLSTDSGIPDYRSPGARPRTPIHGPAFARDAAVRARYWARSLLGWPLLSRAAPNVAHLALVRLERAGRLTSVLTQNVDGLHQAAGSARVLELHGAVREVRCLGCGAREARSAVQSRLEAENPQLATARAAAAPDGDAELSDAALAGFRTPSCLRCGGLLRPDVVFFGENVPRQLVEEALARVEEADALLVLGSSLQVFSGLRFVRHAAGRGQPIAIVNRGETRGDPLARFRIDAALGELLPALATALGA